MIYRLLFLIALCWSSAASAGYKIKHLEPAFWWAGMESNFLQLLVHGENIAELEPVIKYPGVEIKQIHRVANVNYLFVDLWLADAVKPGELPIEFIRDGKPAITVSYPLHEREPDSASRQGFTPADVIYLITPDRFANGDQSNDEVAGLSEGVDRADQNGRHGGDLQGIIEHLDYIADMGFTQLWLNPVLQNAQPTYSYHGYAITDFYEVDARFGSNALYRQLAQQASQRGVGLIMDMVLNHSGSRHWWMTDLPTPDWINNGGEFTPTSHKRESLHDPHGVDDDREVFSSGWFVPSMPDLNQRNPFLANYLIQNSIWWVEYAGLSGIRVDTYSYSDKTFLSRWTQRLMAEYPHFNIVGEEWSLNPSIVAYWQRGKKTHDRYQSYLPSVMDFPLQNAVVEGLTAKESWSSGLVKLYETLAADFVYADPYNLVVFPDNHDMDRIYPALGEDDRLWRIALTYFLTTRGIPQIFYGTEIQMSHSGSGDHGAIRAEFPGGWPGDSVNGFSGEGLSAGQKNAKAFLQGLLTWRKTSPAIHYGELTHYAPENETYVYFRHYEDDLVMVAINKSGDAIALGTERFHRFLKGRSVARNIITGSQHSLTHPLEVEARSAHVFEIE